MRANTMRIAEPVQAALNEGAAVVALESTIIAHGMPYPVNMETALAVERIVREAGAVPATLGVVGGEIVVGLSQAELKLFASGSSIIKAGERDLPVAVAKKQHAATTAGASIAIAAAAGISVFVTGGIGGVGPLAADDFDVSADLPAIAEYPVITVCAGTKAFMDIAATLEFLETLRVPVAGYRTNEFPMFYSRRSGCKLDWVVEKPQEIADAFAAQLALGVRRGMLVGVPVPESDALPEEDTRAAIVEAMTQIKGRGITGKEVTPFLLRAIKEATAGRSLSANIALICENAAVGARIAICLAL